MHAKQPQEKRCFILGVTRNSRTVLRVCNVAFMTCLLIFLVVAQSKTVSLFIQQLYIRCMMSKCNLRHCPRWDVGYRCHMEKTLSHSNYSIKENK